jgi:hypothetical protein
MAIPLLRGNSIMADDDYVTVLFFSGLSAFFRVVEGETHGENQSIEILAPNTKAGD